MSESTKPTPLSSHTMDSLIRELQSGRAVTTDEGTLFRLESKETQAAFAWYAANQAKWTRNIGKDDVEALADHVAMLPESTTALSPHQEQPKRRTLHLKSIRAHRFAGLQGYGTVAEPPEEFSHDFDRPFTLIEGDNGSGKTSFQSAILWCLTGFIYRPQRPPEPANEPVAVREAGATPRGGEAPEAASAWVMSPVTPLPSAAVLQTLKADPLLLDTWVELTFVDDDNKPAGVVKRKVQRAGASSVTRRGSAPLG